MNLPVRARLTLWYVLLFAVIVGAWAGYIALRVRSDLYAGLDRSLSSRATQVAAVLKNGQTSAFNSASDASLSGVPRTEALAQMLSATGEVVEHSGVDVAAHQIVDATSITAVHSTGSARLETVQAGGKQYRVLIAQLPKTDRYLLVGQATESTDLTIERLVLVMAFSGPLALLAAAVVGFIVATVALRPVARMTAAAANIQINHLDERIPVAGDISEEHGRVDELQQLAITLNDMLERLEAGVRDKRRLVSNASHELQTPLAVMRTELDVYLATADLPDDAVEVLESVREESDRMSRIVRNLLTLARFDDGRIKLLKEVLDFHELAEETVASLADLAKSRHVAVTVEGESAAAPADPEYVRLVLTNLVENALKYAGPDTHVRVESRNEGEEVVVIVEDDGQGIPASALPHLFDRFFRVESARASENNGSGLGLAITKEIIEAHGGRILVESDLGAGTRFTIHWPKFTRKRG